MHDQLESNQCSFKPSINKPSKSVERFEQRLYKRDILVSREKAKEDNQRTIIQKQLELCTFKPAINNLTKPKRPSTAMKLRNNNAESQFSFHPTVNKSNTQKYTKLKEYLDKKPHERLYTEPFDAKPILIVESSKASKVYDEKQFQARQEQYKSKKNSKLKKIEKEAYMNTTYNPTINKKSMQLVKSDFKSRMEKSPPKPRKIVHEDDIECTFHPNVNKTTNHKHKQYFTEQSACDNIYTSPTTVRDTKNTDFIIDLIHNEAAAQHHKEANKLLNIYNELSHSGQFQSFTNNNLGSHN